MTTIFAARRVVPPDLIAPALVSATRINDTGPLAHPPEDNGVFAPRIFDTLTPAPEPPLKIIASSRYQLRIDGMVSSTSRIKHAEACWGTSGTPMLNHTGELNEARCESRISISSFSKMVACSSSKYPSSFPQSVIVCTTRAITWRTSFSRSPSTIRKYFDATILRAFSDHDVGNHTPN